eukprot:10581097-Lingulodinium_polyedra.AAC.1
MALAWTVQTRVGRNTAAAKRRCDRIIAQRFENAANRTLARSTRTPEKMVRACAARACDLPTAAAAD